MWILQYLIGLYLATLHSRSAQLVIRSTCPSQLTLEPWAPHLHIHILASSYTHTYIFPFKSLIFFPEYFYFEGKLTSLWSYRLDDLVIFFIILLKIKLSKFKNDHPCATKTIPHASRSLPLWLIQDPSQGTELMPSTDLPRLSHGWQTSQLKPNHRWRHTKVAKFWSQIIAFWLGVGTPHWASTQRCCQQEKMGPGRHPTTQHLPPPAHSWRGRDISTRCWVALPWGLLSVVVITCLFVSLFVCSLET